VAVAHVFRHRGRDFCIVATGARNPCATWARSFARKIPFGPGLLRPGDQDRIDIQFLPRLEGYIWIFPRCGHLSVGICGKGEPAASLRKRLEQFMTEREIAWKGSPFYSHLLPSLDTGSWKANRTAGRGLDGGGDAAGWWIRSPAKASTTPFVRPTWRRNRCFPKRACRTDWTSTAACCARFRGRPGAGVAPRQAHLPGQVPVSIGARPDGAVTRRSPRFSAVMNDLFAGKQPYLGLKRRLLQTSTAACTRSA